jgi:hypothetical protein
VCLLYWQMKVFRIGRLSSFGTRHRRPAGLDSVTGATSKNTICHRTIYGIPFISRIAGTVCATWAYHTSPYRLGYPFSIIRRLKYLDPDVSTTTCVVRFPASSLLIRINRYRRHVYRRVEPGRSIFTSRVSIWPNPLR